MTNKLFELKTRLQCYEPVGFIELPKKLKYISKQEIFLPLLEKINYYIICDDLTEVNILFKLLITYEPFIKYANKLTINVVTFNFILTELLAQLDRDEETDLTKLIKVITENMKNAPECLGFIRDLPKFIETMNKINEITGMENIKMQISNMIWSFMINFRLYGKPTHKELLHTCLCGPPGSGKTTLGQLLAELWTYSGCINNNNNKPVFDLPDNNRSANDDFKHNFILSSLFKVPERNANLPALMQQQTFITKLRPLVNNLRKRVRAKDSHLEQYCQSKFQEIKSIIKTLENTNDTSIKALPIVIPKSPGIRTIFGSVAEELRTMGISPVSPKPVKFSVFTRGDFIGKYLGHTTALVRKILNEHIGGVIFIDEAYNLCTGSQDTYGQEAITEINSFMTQHPDKIIFIFGGYKSQMQETIFQLQPGLERRFDIIYEIEKYTPKQLAMIFFQQIENYGWKIEDKKAIIKFFIKNKDSFPHFGGSTQKLCKDVKEEFYKLGRKSLFSNNITKDDFSKILKSVSIEIVEKAFETYQSKNTLGKLSKDEQHIINSYMR